MAAPKMEYTRLGNSGLKISKVILGAMSFGSSSWQDWILDEDKALLPARQLPNPPSGLADVRAEI